MMEFMLSLMIPQTNLAFISACLSLILYLRLWGKAAEKSWKEFAEYSGLTLVWGKRGPEITGFYRGLHYKLHILFKGISDKKEYSIKTVLKIRLPRKTDVHLEIYPDKATGPEKAAGEKNKFIIKSKKPLYSYQVLTEDLCQLLEEGQVSLFVKKKEVILEHSGYITDIDYLYMISEILFDTAQKVISIRPVGEDCKLFNKYNYTVEHRCRQCNKDIRAGYYYCFYCGTPL